MQVKEEKMIDWTKIKNPAIADRVREEGRFMMQRCHFGVQGIGFLSIRQNDIKKENAGFGNTFKNGNFGCMCMS